MPTGSDSRALYERVADSLRTSIERGELAPGDTVPPEQELAESHGVSRQTVRQALQQLTNEGLLSSGRGRGRTVRSQARLRWRLSHFESQGNHTADADAWANEVQDQGHLPLQEVSVGLEIPPKAVAERLNLDPEKDIVVVRRRLRYVDDVPFQVADSYFPEDLARGTALMQPKNVSVPGGLLASIGRAQTRMVDEIQIRMPTKDESSRLGLPAGTPVAEHMRTGYDADGLPVRVMVTIAPGDRHTLVYELDAS
ncbi:GntR family transcriptional regulator [Nonomuraea maritima]|uniref:GntR family transcriptional regulator n=1 Tax=Nonomuraea maritima TaxID=683260 RepID=A0A1G9SN06_9ACTN|nr:GntR family transcriptional regulator [Nonomuraea maritima]SDM36804.1 GntR family transcriptional regulator [Nonomuraea maritima]